MRKGSDSMGKGQKLYKRAKEIIPGGTQLLSKRPEMFLPEQWPSYYSKAKGCEVWDLDGAHYYDMSLMGVGSNVLGYAYDPVDEAAKQAIDHGGMCTLNAPEEVGLAELLLSIHPWADMVRYAKAGGEAMSMASRICRAYTGKDIVLVCGYHGWHDWYLAANLVKGDPLADVHLKGLAPSGVPRGLAGSNLIFHYNNIEEFQDLVNNNIYNFKIYITGRYQHSYIDSNLKEYIEYLGFVPFDKLYKLVEKADFIIPFLDPENPQHEYYIADATSGSFQLCYGFLKPMLIASKFAPKAHLNSNNSIVYQDNSDLINAIKKAINLSKEDYNIMQQNLKSTVEKINKDSLNTLQTILGEIKNAK